MENAKTELLEALKNKAKVKCAKIRLGVRWMAEDEVKEYKLKVGHISEDFEAFLNDFDFMYDNGYGGQKLFGTVWFEDGNWLERVEYDGSEWWEHKSCPEIPEDII